MAAYKADFRVSFVINATIWPRNGAHRRVKIDFFGRIGIFRHFAIRPSYNPRSIFCSLAET
jgi:hypothetical protein